LDAAEQLTLEIKFSRIISILSYKYFNGQNDPELLRSFMDEPFMQDESLSTDFTTQYLFHWVNAQFQESKNNHEKALDHFNKSIRVWINNPKYIDAHPRLYLGACFTYFKYLIHQKDPFSNLFDDINYNVLISKINLTLLSVGEEAKYKLVLYLFQILFLRSQGKYNEMIKLVTPFLEDENYINSIPDFEKVIFCYYSAQAFFEAGNNKIAENILFGLLNPLDFRLARNPV
jgi:hypothetical protein